MDTTGRSYMLSTHDLPSARGHGEPVTGRLNLPQGALISAMLTGRRKDQILIASDAGYGFIASVGDLHTKNKNGKAMLTLPKGARPLPPLSLPKVDNMNLMAITSEGRMLIFPLTDLPVLQKGKGNKIINIPAKRASERLELLVQLYVLPQECKLVFYSGKRHFTLTPGNMENFISSRGLRGKKLPRGYQNVDRVEIIEPETESPSEEHGDDTP
jgi:topoisomerase-4 subunit A